MKKNFKSLIGGTVIASALALAPSAAAQNLLTGYFDDNYLYRYQSNPAFGNEGNGFVSFPGLSNVNITMNGTIGVSHLLYNVNGKTTTFLNPGVSASEVLDGMKDKCRLGLNVNENILAVGFKAFGGYNTVAVNARVDATVALPKDIFRLAKEGLSNSTYDLSHLGAQGAAWGEIALGHSRDINKRLRVGAAVKVLLGVGSAKVDVKEGNLQLRNDKWIAQVDAAANASINGMRYETSYNEDTNRDYVDGVNFDDFSAGINGFGLGFDLGAVYTLNEDWQFSASVLDLSFIRWKNNLEATTDGLQQVQTDDYSFNVDNNDSWDKFTDNLSNLYQLKDNGDLGSRTTGVGATVNVAAQYTLPVYRKAKFGLLSTTRINDAYSWTDVRLQATVEPVKCFSATADLGMGTFGFSFGWMLNFKTTGFNFFLASDRTPGKLAKQGVPLNSNMNVNFGFNFPF